MGYEIDFSLVAEQDLQEIVEYIAQDNESAATRVANEILNRLQKLTAFPRSGHVIPEFERDDLREILYKSYRIAYLINDENKAIKVVRIWHAARGDLRLGK